MLDRKRIIAIVAVITALVIAPFALDAESSYVISFLFLCFVNIAMAQAWNIVGGYAGQISLGQHAFFGIGGYVTAIIWLNKITGTGYYFDPLLMLASGVGAAILAIMIGIPLLSKLRGDYFALGTLGLGEILRVIVIKGGRLTGGTNGLFLPSDVYSSIRPYYFVGIFLALLGTAMIYFTARSRVGLALTTLKEDEVAAASNGINVLKYKVIAFAMGAFLTGLCASLQAYYVFHIHPMAFFNLNWTLYPILMTVLGGIGTVMGPIVGGVFLTGIFALASIYLTGFQAIFSGTLIILVMLFLPQGLVRFRRKRDAADTKVIKYALFLLILKCIIQYSGTM